MQNKCVTLGQELLILQPQLKVQFLSYAFLRMKICTKEKNLATVLVTFL